MKTTSYWKTISKQKHPIKFIISRILMRLNLSHFFIIKQKNYSLKFYPSSLSQAIWIDPDIPHTATIFFEDYLKPDDIVIDIGSNIGTVTLTASKKVGSQGKVYSIEPNPTIFEYLEGNIKLNNLKNIECFNIALGNEVGTVNFSDEKSDWGNSILSEGEGIKVDIKKLDDLGINDSNIVLIKIDTQGFEKFALTGANRILSITECVHFPVIEKYFENYGYSYKDIFDIFIENGFHLFLFSSDKKIWSIPKNYIPNNEDVLAIKNIDHFIKRTNYKLLTNDK